MVELTKIFDEKSKYNKWLLELTTSETQCVYELMKEAYNQVVDLCSKKAKTWATYKPVHSTTTLPPDVTHFGVDKDSILNVKNLIV